MKKIFTVLILLLLTSSLFADWGLWDSDRSNIVLNIKSSSNSFSLWDGGTGTFQGTNFGVFTTGDILEINSFYIKTWKNGTSDVTDTEYFYAIYETGARPSSPTFISLGGGWLENLDGSGNQKWGSNNLSVDLLSGLAPSKNYTLEIYGRVDGNNPSKQEYDNNNSSSTNYTATFTTDAALPVELTSFSAFTNGENVTLNWQTATEVNNYGFEIQKQKSELNTENSAWTKVGFVDGHGNSNSLKSYSFADNSTSSGKYSYRLKQIDIDGSFEYSQTVEVDLDIPSKFELTQNYPNPFNPTTTISYTIPVAELGFGLTVLLKIYDMLGKEVATLVNEEQASGNYSVQFDASKLSSGIYYYTLKTEKYSDTKKMLLLK